jgi:gluconolactonase
MERSGGVIFTSGLDIPEGPVVLTDGSWLVVEMSPDRGCVTQITRDGTHRQIARTGRPNGLAVDRHGRIWVAESHRPSLLRLSMDGAVDVVATECGGEPFLFPNDLCFGPDGALYLTDSGILFAEYAPGGKIRPDSRQVRIDGRVYRVDPRTAAVTRLDSGIRFANGIAFDAENNLYVSETHTGAIYRYRWKDGAVAGERETFGNVIDPRDTGERKGPDGMAFDVEGRLYVTVYGQGDVTVLGRDGGVVERIKTQGRLPTNVAFGPAGERRIYVTEVEFGAVEVFDVAAEGLRLHT